MTEPEQAATDSIGVAAATTAEPAPAPRPALPKSAFGSLARMNEKQLIAAARMLKSTKFKQGEGLSLSRGMSVGSGGKLKRTVPQRPPLQTPTTKDTRAPPARPSTEEARAAAAPAARQQPAGQVTTSSGIGIGLVPYGDSDDEDSDDEDSDDEDSDDEDGEGPDTEGPDAEGPDAEGPDVEGHDADWAAAAFKVSVQLGLDSPPLHATLPDSIVDMEWLTSPQSAQLPQGRNPPLQPTQHRRPPLTEPPTPLCSPCARHAHSPSRCKRACRKTRTKGKAKKAKGS